MTSRQPVFSRDQLEHFYSETGRWWGAAESDITERDQARVATVRRLTGVTSGRLLDLGSSYGNTAAACALAGYTVTGIEISDRIEFAQRHLERVTRIPGAGDLTFLRADFSAFEPAEPFHLVTYWNGFGVGTDAEQRELLTLIATRWLAPGGYLVMDVFNPTRWVTWAGGESHREAAPEQGYPYSVSEHTDYDPVTARFIDTWTREGRAQRLTQSQRCYSPADLLLLVEPTELQPVAMEVRGQSLDPAFGADSSHPLFDDHEYQVVLRRVDRGMSNSTT